MIIPFHIVAYKAATENCDRALMNKGKHRGATAMKKLITALQKPSEDDSIVDLRDALTSHLQATMSTVVFSAMTLEAFINDIAARKLKKQEKVYRDLFGRGAGTTIETKWRRVPRYLTGREISETSLKMLQRTIRLRNALMHYTPPDERLCFEEIIEFAYAKQGAEAFTSVEIILRDLGNLDDSEDLGWIDAKPEYLKPESLLMSKLIADVDEFQRRDVGFVRRR